MLALGLSLCAPLTLAIGLPVTIAARAAEDSELKQGEPEPLEKINAGTNAGTSSGAPVLPSLSIEREATETPAAESNESQSQSENKSLAIHMPSSDTDASSTGGDTAGDSSSGVNAAGMSETGLPTTASLSAGGPLQLSLPTNEYILPSANGSVLRGRVTESPERSPLLSGSVQTIPDGLKVDLTLQGNLNSEVSQKGSEVFARISTDVTDGQGNKVYLPGGWVAHGFVTQKSGQMRHGRAGWAEVTFDKIISPDGNYDVPFEAKLSTKDNTVTAVSKIIATDTKYMSIGAAAGAVLSVQMTGIPLAVASHGYSVAIGAGVGAAIGLFGAVRHKGNILNVYPGEHLKLTTTGSIQMPGFNLANLPSAKPKARVIGLYMQINQAKLIKDDTYEDKKARILRVNFTVENHSQREFLLNNVRVVSELNEIYYPHFRTMGIKYSPLVPKSSQTLTIPFSVDSGKHSYWLLLTDAAGKEVRREPIKFD